MAGKQIAGDNLTSHLAGMSKNQLYDVMSQMKALIEQNQQQARQILVENPLLTKALFQAQIMLGMVQLPQVMPNIQQTLSQASQQPPPVQPCQPLIVPPTQSLPGQSVLAGQSGSSQLQYPSRQQSSQSFPFTSATAPPLTLPSQTGPQHFKAQLGAQISSTSLPQPSLSHHPPAAPHHSASPPSSVPQPSISSQSQQQTLQAPGIHHQPLKPPMLPQPRPSSLQPFSHQMHSQIGPSAGFQPPQQLMSQPMFHVGGRGGAEYSSNQGATSMQVDRGAPWMSGPVESSAGGAHLPGPPLVQAQMASGARTPRPPQLTPEMEKAVLQQVMSLTPEQINLLPPEQRQQVLQLQQMLR
ncbi:cleavage stimulating factor 64-like isoform X1 [Aristolochia californica]|uniref:cleavage stimulating factor 64-like isoform X1 n=1 Tax=Aristolochia californica TaxID=171875 RepID=UPI0035DB20A7